MVVVICSLFPFVHKPLRPQLPCGNIAPSDSVKRTFLLYRLTEQFFVPVTNNKLSRKLSGAVYRYDVTVVERDAPYSVRRVCNHIKSSGRTFATCPCPFCAGEAGPRP